MSSIILAIIGSLLLVFLDTVSTTAGLISISIIAVLVLYDRMRITSFIVLFAVFSIIVDSYFSFWLGTHFVVFMIVTMLFALLRAILPYGRTEIRWIIIFISFMSFHLLVHLAITVQIGGISDIDLLSALTSSIVKVVFESVIFSAILYGITNYLGDNFSSVKVKV